APGSLSPRRMLGSLADLRTTARLFHFSVPGAADNLSYNFSQLLLVKCITALGTSALLIRSYTLAVNGFISVVVLAASQANETLVGYDKGAGDGKAARRRVVRTTVLTSA